MSAVHADRDGSEPRARNYGDALSSFIHQTKELAKKDRQVAELKAENVRLQTELIDDMVARWHDAPDMVGGELHEYLGMTEAQYSAWAQNPSSWIAKHGSAWFKGRFPEGG